MAGTAGAPRTPGAEVKSTGPKRKSRFGDGSAFLLDALRARPVVRRLLSGVSVLFAVVAVGLLAYPFATNVYSNRLQNHLEAKIQQPEIKKAYQAGTLEVGDPLTRIKIPSIGVSTVVVEGTSASALRAGAGHYPNTPLPGEAGNVAIAGHRTTYGKPFADLDRMKVGDEIVLETPVGNYTYKVAKKPFVVPNTEWNVISQSPGHELTLTSCHPKGSAKQRIVVKAEKIDAPA